eukprot:UN12850
MEDTLYSNFTCISPHPMELQADIMRDFFVTTMIEQQLVADFDCSQEHEACANLNAVPEELGDGICRCSGRDHFFVVEPEYMGWSLQYRYWSKK